MWIVVSCELKVVSVTQAYMPTCDDQGLLIWPSEFAYRSRFDVDKVDTPMISVLHPILPFPVRMYMLPCMLRLLARISSLYFMPS